MKRFITPLLFFGAVLSVSAFFLKYSFCQMEALGYFAFSPDYLREVFCSSLPLSHLMSDFLTQVFRYVMAGPLTMAVVMLIFFLMLRSILRRFGFGSDIVPIVISLTLWWFSSKAESFLLPSAALLMVFVVFLVSRYFHRLSSDSIWKWDVPVSATLVIAVSVAVILTPKVKDNERWAEVEYFAYRQDWNRLLDVTTVDAVRKDHSLIQFALLGLSCTDQLGNRMFEYDVRGAQDLDAEGINDRRGYYFSSILYHSLGLPNEALHNIFQSNCALEHGVSFRGLRQMVRYNYEKGDYTLVKKYCILLKHSMFNDKFADSYLALADTVPAIVDTSFNLSRTAPVCDHNKKHELITLFNNGYSSRMIVERILCYQLAEGDVESFRTNMELFVPYYREVPRHFMEAMELTPVIPGIGENLYYKYIRRMNESLAATDDTQKI